MKKYIKILIIILIFIIVIFISYRSIIRKNKYEEKDMASRIQDVKENNEVVIRINNKSDEGIYTNIEKFFLLRQKNVI